MSKLICFVFYSWMLSFALPVSAQQADAKEILDRTAAAFRQAGGIQAEFTVMSYLKGKLQGSSAGTIQLKGDKFVLDAEGVKTWFDGRTQWSYLVNSDEVNISEPTAEELQSLNPYSLLSMYKQGYRLKLGPTENYRGKPVYEIIMTATQRQQDLKCVILYVAKDTFQPLCVSMAERGGNSVAVHASSFRTGQNYSDSLFAFNKKGYPTAEVIDLR